MFWQLFRLLLRRVCHHLFRRLQQLHGLFGDMWRYLFWRMCWVLELYWVRRYLHRHMQNSMWRSMYHILYCWV